MKQSTWVLIWGVLIFMFLFAMSSNQPKPIHIVSSHHHDNTFPIVWASGDKGRSSDVLLQSPLHEKFLRSGTREQHEEWLETMGRIQRPVRHLPDAIIIGCKKCGTGVLKSFLSLNPYIVTTKHEEVHFFDTDHRYVQGLDFYRQMLPPALPGQVVMEKTPSYSRRSKVPGRIFAMNPNIKLVMIVRDPTKRIISDYKYEKMLQTYYGNEQPEIRERDLTFEQCFFKNDGSVNTTWERVWTGFYAEQLQMWLHYFKAEQILILDGDRFITDPIPILNQVERFFNIPTLISSKNVVYDKEKDYFCKKLDGEVECSRKGKTSHRNDIVSEEVLRDIRRFYAPYNERFYRLTGMNFKWPTS